MEKPIVFDEIFKNINFLTKVFFFLEGQLNVMVLLLMFIVSVTVNDIGDHTKIKYTISFFNELNIQNIDGRWYIEMTKKVTLEDMVNVEIRVPS